MVNLTGMSVAFWIVLAVFFFGSILNAVGPGPLRAQYAGWGYPSWFRFVTAILEMATAILLLFPATRFFGVLLGGVILLAAAATLIRGKQYPVVLIPATVFALIVIVGMQTA